MMLLYSVAATSQNLTGFWVRFLEENEGGKKGGGYDLASKFTRLGKIDGKDIQDLAEEIDTETIPDGKDIQIQQ